MPKTQVAVEITEESVRAIEVSLGRTPTVVAAGEVPVPPGAAKDSEVLDRDAVAVALQRLWAEARISQRNVVLGVGNRRILVREHSTQLTNPAQIRQALPFEVVFVGQLLGGGYGRFTSMKDHQSGARQRLLRAGNVIVFHHNIVMK